MPSEIRLFPNRNLALFRYFGEFVVDDCINAMTNFVQAPGFRRDMAHLVCLKDVTEVVADFAAMLGLVLREAKLSSYFDPDTPCALVAPGDVTYGVARMYQQLADHYLPFNTAVFRHEQGALAFCGQDVTEIAQLSCG